MESKRLGKLLRIFGAALIAIAIGVPLVQAEAPSPNYRQFTGCPSPKSENPEISSCLRIVLTGGHIRLGKKDIPLVNPTSASGGLGENLGTFSFNPRGGLLPVKEPVSLASSLTGLNALFLAQKVDPRLFAVSELAGAMTFNDFTDLQIPLKIHLINGALGTSCYVGSNAHPLKLSLTTGTTTPPPPAKPLTGKNPEGGSPGEEILRASGGTFVANSFAVPGAEGCGLKSGTGVPAIKVNGLINETIGLPAPAGASEMVQNFDLELVDADLVYP